MASGIETQIYSILSSIFRIPSEWLGFPAVLTYLIVPFIIMAYAFYKLLEKLRIFGYHTGIYTVLAVVFALILLPFGPLVAVGAAGFIGVVALTSWTSRIIFVAILIIFYFIALPYLASINF